MVRGWGAQAGGVRSGSGDGAWWHAAHSTGACEHPKQTRPPQTNTATPTGAGTKWERPLCNRRDVQPCQESSVQNLAGNRTEPLSLCQAAPAGREMLRKRVWDWRCSFKKKS